MKDRISQLPDEILSYILTMLSVKDLLKTSILSKRWCNLCSLTRDHYWSLTRDPYFDINVLGSSEEELLHKGYLINVLRNSTMNREVNLDMSTKDEFVKRINQFVKNFKGTSINSFLVNFCLDHEQTNTIDQWISFVIARGVGRIDLLFLGRGPYAYAPHLNRRARLNALLTAMRNRYKFDLGVFSKSNASTLKHLHLENCLVCHPTNCDFIQFKNLRALSLETVKLDETFIESLLSNCPRLEELFLFFCEFKSLIPNIVSSSLCHLKIIGCYSVCNYLGGIYKHKLKLNLILLDCLKLTSLELDDRLAFNSSKDGLDTLNFNAPELKNIVFSVSRKEELNAFVALSATLFPKLEVMHVTTIFTVTTSLKINPQLKYLKQLHLTVSVDLHIFDDVECDRLWILNILEASPLLQKLSIMFTMSELYKKQKDIRDAETFSHDEVKVIELGGCVGNWYEIEFVMNVLKYAHKLEQIVAGPYWRERPNQWNNPPDLKSNPLWFESGRERMREKLQTEGVVGREKLVLI